MENLLSFRRFGLFMLLSFSNDSFTDEDVIFFSGIVGEGKFESIPDHTSGVPA